MTYEARLSGGGPARFEVAFRRTPEIEVIAVEVPSRWGPLGAKGLGEAATLPTAPAILTRAHKVPVAVLREEG